ncbi:putative fluoride ion transporter CrcB [Bienertia sinuspersici]
MAGNETGHKNKDDGAIESQARLSGSLGRNRIQSVNSAPSVIEGLSYSLHENAAGIGAASCQLMRNYSTAQASSSGASLRRLFSLSGACHSLLEEDLENEIVSQAGDIGDRTVSRKGSQKDSSQFAKEQGIIFPVPEEFLDSYGFWSNDPGKSNTISPVSPFVSDIITPPPSSSLLHKKQEENKVLPPFFEYVSYLIHLAVFGILGVFTRYLLQKLFGSSVIGVTSDQSILYADLPSNMVGSFLMGWFGVVFKSKISHMSDPLAVGISTGYLGSVTTFSGWNQKMLDLSINGHWVFAVLGFVIGLFLAAYSIIIGVETAKGFEWLLERNENRSRSSGLRMASLKSHVIVVTVLMLVWVGLWTTSGVLEKKKFKDGGSGAQLWLGCLVCPLGVWLRWWLARFNGRGLGHAERWKWIPFGTLTANANTKNCVTIAGGIQLGLMGCLSTVSTFMAEFNAMRESSHPWRAYTYAFITISMSFALGTLIYSVPVWTLGYN